MKLSWPFQRKTDSEDFSSYLSEDLSSSKSALITKCQRQGVSIFVNDTAETSVGVYANLRGVASEAELHSRLQHAMAVRTAVRANIIAWSALLVSLASLIVALLK